MRRTKKKALTRVSSSKSTGSSGPAQAWVQILAKYRNPDPIRSVFELCVSIAPFLALWGIAWWALSVSYVLAFFISVLNALFLVRLFAIQHDCGHGSFFSNSQVSDWVGRALGVLTLTPYDVWRRTHSIHHAASGNLDKRGIGEISTLTVDEYLGKTRLGRLQYRTYRNPFFLFGLAPSYLFLLQNRLPLGLMRAGWKYWVSAMGTNAVIFVILFLIAYFGGLMPILFIFLPTSIIGATIGVWLFYVQHQFEEAHWDTNDDWQVHDAALHGSSHYVLPPVLQWMTANIGIHHVHHLYSRIPFYRLTEVLRDHRELAEAQQLSLRESFACARLHLWDESQRKLLSFAQVRAAQKAS